MVGHAHIDLVWLWKWDEGLQVVISTFNTVLALMRKFPEFIFVSSSAIFYKWVEENEPEMFEEIKKRVKEGKWQIVGGWWVEPDCNIPSGESLTRHSLYAQRYFLEKFGKMATVGFNPDSFGHNWMLPQIFKKSGINYYIFMRPGPHEKELPTNLFWWQAPDGSMVLTYRIPLSYSTGNLGEHIIERIDKLLSQLNSIYPTSKHDVLCFYGIGDHGGGPSAENIKTISKLSSIQPSKTTQIKKLLPQSTQIWKIIFSSPEKFFRDELKKIKIPSKRKEVIKNTLPTVIDDLQYHSKGCYSAHSEVKKLNRESEDLLILSEKFASIASSLTNLTYPVEDFKRAWQNVLFCQFHDILAGTSCPESYEDVRNNYGEALSIASRALYYSLGKIARRINTKFKCKSKKEKLKNKDNIIPIVVFNPSSYPKVAPIELEYGFGKETITIFDTIGEINIQQIQTSVTVGEGKKRFVFTPNVPAMGYKTYWAIRHNKTEDEKQKFECKRNFITPKAFTENTMVIENNYFLIELESKTGYIVSLIDKRTNYNLIKDKSAVPIVINDPSDTWSHGVEEFKNKIGAFSNSKITLIERGTVRSKIRIENYFNKSSLVQEIILYEELPFIEFHCFCDWHEKLKLLKITFQLNLKSTEVFAGIPFGYIKRKNDGKEFTAQNWICVFGEIGKLEDATGFTRGRRPYTKNRGCELIYGVALISDSKYSFDVKDSKMSLTVLRSPVYAHHDPTKLKPGEFYKFQDQGANKFIYRLHPHVIEAKKQNVKNVFTTFKPKPSPLNSSFSNVFELEKYLTEIIRNAEDLHQPLIHLIDSIHAGEFPNSQSFIKIESLLRTSSAKEEESKEKNIIISAVKLAEDKSGIILRAYETSGEEIKVKINIPFLRRKFSATFSPFEIKTFKIPLNRNKPIKEVNLIEF